jgi:F-type H+-transporting ATPase subunit epsilon
MELDIITPDKKVFSGTVARVKVPGTMGAFEVLNYHAPIISTLGAGYVRYKENGQQGKFKITGGVIEVKDNKVVILAESIIEES